MYILYGLVLIFSDGQKRLRCRICKIMYGLDLITAEPADEAPLYDKILTASNKWLCFALNRIIVILMLLGSSQRKHRF